MTKGELERLMLKIYGSPFIKLARISELVGDSNPQRVKQNYLSGLQSFNGRYFIPEVAERIAQNMK